MPLLLVNMDLVDLVPNVASNLWSAHFQNYVSMMVTGSNSMAKKLLFLLFGSICVAAIENAKNKSQSSFMSLTSVLIFFFNRILNSFVVHPISISHSTTSYGTTASLGNLNVVKFVIPVVSHMA